MQSKVYTELAKSKVCYMEPKFYENYHLVPTIAYLRLNFDLATP